MTDGTAWLAGGDEYMNVAIQTRSSQLNVHSYLAPTKSIKMPTVIEETHSPIRGGHPDARPRISRPLEYSGSLDRYQNQDLTPVIGREYEGLQVAEILQSSDRDQLIQDLAATSRLN
jgi:hypothetical protein